MNKERYKKYVEIAKRAEDEGIYNGERITLLMDIESADRKFNLRLDDWLNADKFNFAHDLCGVVNNIDRTEFPTTDFGLFVPRFAEEYEDDEDDDDEDDYYHPSSTNRDYSPSNPWDAPGMSIHDFI